MNAPARLPINKGVVLAVWAPPMGQGRMQKRLFDAGKTLTEIVAEWDCLPRDFRRHGVIMLDGCHQIEQRYWKGVRVKEGQSIVLQRPMAGGGGKDSGVKNGILGLFLGIATLLTAGLVAAAGIPGLFAGGTLAAKLAAGAVSMLGALIQSALVKPPTAPKQKSVEDAGAASASGNLLQRGAPVPRVIGERWIFPSLVSQPLITRDGGDEYAEAIFALGGPHKFIDMRLGAGALADAEDIEYQTREGWPDDVAIDLVGRYGVTDNSVVELSTHTVDGDNQDQLKNQSAPERSLPTFTARKSAKGADEVHLALTLPQGLYSTSNEDRYRIPIRIRIRQSDSDPWICLPEIHYQSNDKREIRPDIVLSWSAPPEMYPTIPSKEGWLTAFNSVPGQTGTPTTDPWAAHSSFSSGAGDTYLQRDNLGTSAVVRVAMDQYRAAFYLDPAQIPKGSYQIQIKRGIVFNANSWSSSNYQFGGNVRDLFSYYVDTGVAKIASSRENKSDRIYLVRSASIFNSHPVAGGRRGPGVALIVIRAKNRAIDTFKVLAAGYVRDWDGAAWANWTTTSRPAAHFRDILVGLLSPSPLLSTLIDEPALLDWRANCIAKDYTCDMICEGAGIADVLTTIAACGYARPRMSETWGVIQDYDRSAEEPVQVFTSRNSRGLSMSKAFVRFPDALRVTFKDASNEDADKEIVVYRPDRPPTTPPKIEAVTYDGISTEAAARARGLYDYRQMIYRSAFWDFEAPAEAVKATRGSLILVNHSVLDKRSQAAARIVGVDIIDNQIVRVQLDARVPVFNELTMEDITDMTAVADMTLVGARTGISVRDAAGDQIGMGAVSGATGRRSLLDLSTPINVDLADDEEPLIREGNLCWIYSIANVSRRMIVANVEYDEDLVARISAINEGREIFA